MHVSSSLDRYFSCGQVADNRAKARREFRSKSRDCQGPARRPIAARPGVRRDAAGVLTEGTRVWMSGGLVGFVRIVVDDFPSGGHELVAQ